MTNLLSRIKRIEAVTHQQQEINIGDMTLEQLYEFVASEKKRLAETIASISDTDFALILSDVGSHLTVEQFRA